MSAPVAFVTGAAGGIGRASVSALRGRGLRVYATDIALAAIPCGQTDFVAASLDVTSETAVGEQVAAALASFGRIDHVVHLAGRAGAGSLDATTLADWHTIVDVNLTSAFLIARATHAALRESRGTLTLMASTNGLNGGTALSGPAYAVAKAGIVNLTRYLAREWARDGIRVNCLAPGPIETPMVTDRFDAQTIEGLIRSVPLRRLGQPDDIAHAIDYLTSPRAGFVTGTVMNLSGGLVFD